MTVTKGLVIAAISVVTVLLVGIGVLGAMVAAPDDRGSSIRNPGRMTQMEQSGQMHEMLQDHQDMIDRMRTDASPQMLREMKNDEMTQMMNSGEMIRMAEEHQADIDRMMGRMPDR